MDRISSRAITFELSEFNVILDMDWLGESIADILCGRKMVRISPPRREPFVIYRDKSKVNSRVIMMMKSRRCLPNRCSTFIAYVIYTKKEKREMTNIPVVRDFS